MVVRNAPLLKIWEHSCLGILESTSHLRWTTEPARTKPRNCFRRAQEYPGSSHLADSAQCLLHSRCSVTSGPLLRWAQNLQAGGLGGDTLTKAGTRYQNKEVKVGSEAPRARKFEKMKYNCQSWISSSKTPPPLLGGGGRDKIPKLGL